MAASNLFNGLQPMQPDPVMDPALNQPQTPSPYQSVPIGKPNFTSNTSPVPSYTKSVGFDKQGGKGKTLDEQLANTTRPFGQGTMMPQQPGASPSSVPFQQPQPNYFKVIDNRDKSLKDHGFTSREEAWEAAAKLDKKHKADVHIVQPMSPTTDPWFNKWTPEQRLKGNQIRRNQVPGIPGATWKQ